MIQITQRAFFSLVCFLLFVQMLKADPSNQLNQSRIKHFLLNSSGIAIEGYDPVSYFQGSPQKGVSEIHTTYKGIKYLFASEENKKKFLLSPDAFEPEYGGWCAYAMGESGDKVEIDPKRFKIVDGKLNLFYNGLFGDTLKPWNDKENLLKPNAKANWQKIIQNNSK